MTISALESYLDVLLTRARYGRKLGAFAHSAYRDMERISVVESDRSLPAATRKRLVRECEASLGKCLRLAAKHGKAQQVADVVSKRYERQSNQDKVFRSYRVVMRREGRVPTFSEWLQEDLNGRKIAVSASYKRSREHSLREMQGRFKLPITLVS